jgi:hypothetical protein
MPFSTNSARQTPAPARCPVPSCQLARNGEFDLAGKLRVLALLGGLDRVPELFSVGKFLRRAFRQHHFGMDDSVLVGEIMVTVEPVVVQPFGPAIGCGGHGAAPARPADDFNGEVEDRHDGNPSTPPSARRHDV